MSLSPGIVKDILVAAEDNEITGSEVTGMVSGMISGAVTGMMMVFMVTAFIKATNPPKEEAREILEIAREI